MSLKQYSPHLQLTIHRSGQFILGLRLLSVLMVGLAIISSDNTLLVLFTCCSVLILHTFTEYKLHLSEQKITINEYVVRLAVGEFDLQELRILFGYIVLISFQCGRKPLLLSRDQLSYKDWQGLVRYSKLQK